MMNSRPLRIPALGLGSSLYFVWIWYRLKPSCL
jgi:hypothetical protein